LRAFKEHGWGDQWRDGIYPYLQFHTGTHEVLGIARGNTRVQFGGARGRTVGLKAGDVVILPAGTGHRRMNASKDLLVVGAVNTSGPGQRAFERSCGTEIGTESLLSRYSPWK
jgi:uncharacterized protein YjlB